MCSAGPIFEPMSDLSWKSGQNKVGIKADPSHVREDLELKSGGSSPSPRPRPNLKVAI